jgi:hypothetical protein
MAFRRYRAAAAYLKSIRAIWPQICIRTRFPVKGGVRMRPVPEENYSVQLYLSFLFSVKLFLLSLHGLFLI